MPDSAKHTVLAGFRISDGAGILLWASVKSLSIETRKSERTIYYRRRRMRLLGIATIVRQANTWSDCPNCKAHRETRECSSCKYVGDSGEFRRSATYALNIAKISSFQPPKEHRGVPWRSYKEYRAATRKKRPHSAAQSSQVQSTQASAHTSPQPIGQSPKFERVHRGAEREPNRREREEMARFVAKVREYMRGVTRTCPPEGGMGHPLEPGDRGYRAPMQLDNAITAACMWFGNLSERKAREWLKLLPRSLEEEST